MIKFIICLKIIFLFSAQIYAENINEKTSVIAKVKELGQFVEPKIYPNEMKKLFQDGCNAFSCTADNLALEMVSRFNRKGVFLEKYPGTQLHAMAMFEVFYQKNLKDNEDKIEEFIATANDEKKNKKKIVSLIKLNEARRKMRSSLGMDLKLSPEKAIENYWTMGDFLNQGESKKNKVNKEVNKRRKIIKQYRKIVNKIKTSDTKEKEKTFYNKVLDKKTKSKLSDLKKDTYIKFNDDLSKIRKKIANLPEGKTGLAKNFDKSMVEINKLADFLIEKLQQQDQTIGNKGLNLLSKKLASIENKLTKEYSNDLSKVDINKISKNAAAVIDDLTKNMKERKVKDNNKLISDMAEINRQGFNSFKLNRDLKQIGFENIKFEDISKFLENNSSVEKLKDNPTNLVQNRVDLISNLMNKLGYKSNEINKEIEIIRTTGINTELSQNILTARQMLISGASDKEIQDEISLWDSMHISNLHNDAYLTAINARSQGLEAKDVKRKIEVINAVETYREVDKLISKVGEQIEKSKLVTSVPDGDDLDENVQVFAQAGGIGYTNNFFSNGNNDLFYNKFLEEQKNKQIEVFQKKYNVSEIYNEINTPLTVVSVIVSPNPLNILKLAKMAKEQADEKKARILAAASFGTGEDELGAGDYVDPRIFERTMRVLNSIKIKDIQSKNLAKKLNYSIRLISLKAAPNDIPKQLDDDNLSKDVCLGSDCFVMNPPKQPTPINPIMPIDNFIKNAEKVKKGELVKNFQAMIQDKNITNIELSNRTLSNAKVIDYQLYLEATGIKDASKKVSDAYAAVGLSKDGMPSLDAIIDPSFDITAHLDAMGTVASEAGLQADIASASQAAADVQDAINAASGQISEELAQANAEAQQALADAQRALDESRKDPNADGEGESCSSGGGTC